MTPLGRYCAIVAARMAAAPPPHEREARHVMRDRVLMMIQEGARHREIARALGMSTQTISNIRKNAGIDRKPIARGGA